MGVRDQRMLILAALLPLIERPQAKAEGLRASSAHFEIKVMVEAVVPVFPISVEEAAVFPKDHVSLESKARVWLVAAAANLGRFTEGEGVVPNRALAAVSLVEAHGS